MENYLKRVRVALHNLGCKVNSYELDVIRRQLAQGGFEIVPFDSPAEVYVINTCTVTNIADRKSRQMIHRARAMNGNALVVALGCYVDKDSEPDNDIDIALGNKEKSRLIDILKERFETTGCSSTDILNCDRADADSADTYSAGSHKSLSWDAYSDDEKEPGTHTRAFLKIQDGCNRFCTYCIIPYVRGRIESRAKADILKESAELAERGFRELVLTGIHISSYGADRGEEPQEALTDLIVSIADIEGIERIRLGSLEPMLITEPFVQRLSAIDELCPHFHLSLQSGSDSVLKRMNRRYTMAQYVEGVALLRRYFAEPAITTDIIVGFPGESEREFEETLAYARQLSLSGVHIFKYSKREGTPAAAMEGQLTEAQKSDRAGELRRVTKTCEEEWLTSHIGRELEVLFEEAVHVDGVRYMSGHSREYISFYMETDEDYTNRIVNVEGSRVQDGSMWG